MTNKKIELKEQKQIILDILLDVSNFCNENNITYFLACGTLLGAIRHKGFIPWDDDADIMMPRPDYNKFLNVYKSSKYKILKPIDGLLNYAKVYDKSTIKYEPGIDYKKYNPIGIDIDIFPLDGIVNDDIVVNRMYKKECFLEMLLRLSVQPIFYRKNPLKAINRIIPRIVGSKNIVKMIEKHSQKYPYNESDYVIRLRRSTNGFTGALPKSVYEKDYKEFEGHMFCVPKGYEKWLTAFYGDYMKIPSKDKQVNCHIYEAYRRIENEN